MPFVSRIIISAAGGGKTTRVVDQALAHVDGTVAVVTYTRNNVREIHSKIYDQGPVVPRHVEVISWYSLLLRELARPYRSAMHSRRIDGILWTEARSVPMIPARNIAAHYFKDGSRIYSDKIAKFICECDQRSGGAIMARLKQRFSRIIVDEIQDMAGYDLDLLELMLKSGIPLTMVGDHRQATFATNNAAKNSQFAGPAILKKFEMWRDAGLVTIDYERATYRANQAIAGLGDTFFPNEPATVSRNTLQTGHDGLFIVSGADVPDYLARYAPQVLRYSAKTTTAGDEALNFGESKGMTFDRVLIFPHGPAKKWLGSGALSDIEKSAAKMYVAVTRARHSVAFVFDGPVCVVGATRWAPNKTRGP